MLKLYFKEGLLYVSILLRHAENDIIVDTGASHTIILSDYLAELDVEMSDTDELVKSSGYGGMICGAVRKKMDRIEVGDMAVEDMKIDFGVIDPYDRINGLLGLDFLRSARAVIDLDSLVIFEKNMNANEANSDADM